MIHSLKNGLKGAFAHANPIKAISELDIDLATARKRLTEDTHSIWDILFHLVFWQEIFIENIKGNDPKWDDEGSWPTDEHLQEDSNFDKLRKKFVDGIKEINNLIENENLEERLEFWRNEPKLQFVVVAMTHNSYHTAQILLLKNAFLSKRK